jgi:chloride channel 3/4/5
MRHVDDNTLCSFVAGPSTQNGDASASSGHNADDTRHLFDEAPGPSIGIEDDVSMDIIENTVADGGGIQMWPWVHQTPLTVSPQLPLEIVMQLFQRMGWVLQPSVLTLC